MPDVRIHPTAIVEPGVTLGRGTSIWDNVHIRRDAVIGDECIVGEKTYIAYGVKVGHRCKLNSFVYVCAAVTLEDGVMVSAATVFTNDRFPRATGPDLKSLLSSDLADDTPQTLVREGATIGANCTIGPGLTIGRWAMVGMGSVVTKDVPDFALVVGNPARVVGAVCKCGTRIAGHTASRERERPEGSMPPVAHTPGSQCDSSIIECPACRLRYTHADGRTAEAA